MSYKEELRKIYPHRSFLGINLFSVKYCYNSCDLCEKKFLIQWIFEDTHENNLMISMCDGDGAHLGRHIR